MKVQYMSDVHLEFRNMGIPETDADVVVLLGDIALGVAGIRWASLFPQTVLYVAGNHEHYKRELKQNLADLKNEAARFDNVHFLENDSVTIDDITFHGCTLWTDFNLYNTAFESMEIAEYELTDFTVIRYGNELLKPLHTLDMHNISLEWLAKSLERSQSKKNIVLSHHLPTKEAIQTHYVNDVLSPAFSSNCFENLPKCKIDYWFYGHNHDVKEFKVDNTVFLTNQRGYAPESVHKEFDLYKIVIV